MSAQWWGETLLESVSVYVSCLWTTAWCTLLERKLLAAAQRRKGPNKVSWQGALQPVADAIKLVTNEAVIPSSANSVPFLAMPPLALSISLATWHLWPVPCPPHFYQYGGILYLCLTSVHVYTVVLSGWSANSMYSMLGAMRAIGIAISYELPLGILTLSLSVQAMTWDFNQMVKWHVFPFILLNLWIFPVYLFCAVAEMHRAPFDLTEAESELVSGYNTDFGATGFMLLFVSEYANLLVGCQIISALFFWPVSWVSMVITGLLLSAFVLMARAAYPRVKYECFMASCWKSLLPASLLHLGTSFVFCIII